MATQNAQGIPTAAEPPPQEPGAVGLVRVVSPAQLIAQEKAAEAQARKDTEAAVDRLSAYVDQCWNAAQQAKGPVEARILRCRRQVDGQYEPDKLEEIRKFGGSEAIIFSTGTKCEAAMAWFREYVMPPDDKPWSLTHTPIPDLPQELVDTVVEKVRIAYEQRAAAGAPMDPGEAYDLATMLREQQLQDLRDAAAQAATRMERLMEDQLTEGDFYGALEDSLSDFVSTPAGILKGPVVRKRPKLRWAKGGTPNRTDAECLVPERVDPLDFYPSPRCRHVNDGYLLERMQCSRRSLLELKDTDGVNAANLEKALAEYGRVGYSRNDPVDAAKDALVGRTVTPTTTYSDVTIETLEFWGAVPGDVLQEWGLDVEDENEDYEISALKVGRYVIRAVVNPDPLGRRPYHVDSFKRVPGSIWGKGLPEVIADLQDMQNSIARHFQNNEAYSAGPQVGVDVSKLQAGCDPHNHFPFKVWAFENLNGQGLPIQWFQPVNYIQETIAGYRFWQEVLDDVSGVPRYTYGGDQVGEAGGTASGMSMLMSNANKRIRSIVGSIDRKIIRPLLEAYYTYNMLYAPDPAVKGDCEVVARGALALVVKEQQQLRRQEFLNNTGNPVDMQIIGLKGRARLLRAVSQTLDLPEPIVPDDQELEAMAMQNAMQQQAEALAGLPEGQEVP